MLHRPPGDPGGLGRPLCQAHPPEWQQHLCFETQTSVQLIPERLLGSGVTVIARPPVMGPGGSWTYRVAGKMLSEMNELPAANLVLGRPPSSPKDGRGLALCSITWKVLWCLYALVAGDLRWPPRPAGCYGCAAWCVHENKEQLLSCPEAAQPHPGL